MNFLKDLDWSQLSVMFVALLALFRGLAEFLKLLSGFLKKKGIGEFGEKMVKVLDFLSGFIGKFGFGKPTENK